MQCSHLCQFIHFMIGLEMTLTSLHFVGFFAQASNFKMFLHRNAKNFAVFLSFFIVLKLVSLRKIHQNTILYGSKESKLIPNSKALIIMPLHPHRKYIYVIETSLYIMWLQKLSIPTLRRAFGKANDFLKEEGWGERFSNLETFLWGSMNIFWNNTLAKTLILCNLLLTLPP